MWTHVFRDSALGLLGGWAALLKGITDMRAGTVTPAAYTGYARTAVTWGAAANTSPTGGRQRGNNANVTFPANTGANEDQIAWAVYDDETAGDLQAIGLLDTDSPILARGAADDTLLAHAHGLEADQRVFVLAAPGAAIPTGLSENVSYYVLASGLTADVLKLSTASGGAAVDITVGGGCWLLPYKARTVATGATPQLATGQMVVQA